MGICVRKNAYFTKKGAPWNLCCDEFSPGQSTKEIDWTTNLLNRIDKEKNRGEKIQLKMKSKELELRYVQGKIKKKYLIQFC